MALVNMRKGLVLPLIACAITAPVHFTKIPSDNISLPNSRRNKMAGVYEK